MKECSKCKLVKPLSDFDKKTKKKSNPEEQIYSSHCKSCRREYVKSHYDRNKQYYVDKAQRNNTKYRKRFTDYKKTLSCTDCNISFKDEPYLCDFHHEDPTQKDFEIATLAVFSWNKIQKELDKCIPVCANCHRRRHNTRV